MYRESSWANLLYYSTEYDDKFLGDWKDELANLLTFVGDLVVYPRIHG